MRLGEADVVNALKGYSGIDAMGDYGSGVSIDGALPAQTMYSMAGVPVIFPYRFGGIFSSFNNLHFAATHFERNIHGGAMPSRVGALLEYTPYRSARRTEGMANVGLLSTSATVRTPLGKKVSVSASGRVSYVNSLYSRLLKVRDAYINYDFVDFNFSADYRISARDMVTLDLMCSHDNLGFDDDGTDMDTGLRWTNLAGVLAWNRKTDNLGMDVRLYGSGFNSLLALTLGRMGLRVKSETALAGMSGKVAYSLPRGIVETLDCGFEVNRYEILPADNRTAGYGEDDSSHARNASAPCEARAYADVGIPVFRRVDVRAGVSTMYYTRRGDGHYAAIVVDPRVSVTYSHEAHTLTLHAGRYHQPLHQVGFSDIGLASDFRLAAGKDLPLQSATSYAGDYSFTLWNGKMKANVGVYYKKIESEPEYHGMLVEMLSSEFSPEDGVINTRGYNVGINAELDATMGKLSGRVGYGYGVARRRFGNDTHYCRGITSPGHSVKMHMQYKINGHWQTGATFVYRSGRPYTPVTAIYVIAGNLIEQHGELNSARFPAYHRADIWASYTFGSTVKGRSLVNAVNLSVMNAYGHRNVEIQAFALNPDTGTYGMRRIASLYRFMPSISYSLRF